MKKALPYLIWFIALLPILLLRDFTPSNELRYLNIVDEALQNGNIFTFTNQGEIYADKPPLHFWLMMIGKKMLGAHRMWYYALLSIIPALVVISTINRWMRSQKDVDETTTSLMLMTTGFFIGTAIVVRMDMLMNMFIVLAFYSFYQMYQGIHIKRNSLLLPLYTFLALFSKGPLGLLIPVISTLSFLIYKKKLSHFSRYWGWKSLAILLTGCIIWFTGVYLEGGNEYMHNLLFKQTVGRGINSFHHKEPFYYYAIACWYILAPWAFLSIGILTVSLYRKKIKSELEQFFTVIVLSSIVLLSAISSKLAIYAVPVIPFLIGLTLLLLPKYQQSNRWIKLSLAIPAIILALGLPAIIYFSKNEDVSFLVKPLILVSAGILSLTGLITMWLLYKKSNIHKSIQSMSLGILLSIFVAGWAMPQLNPYLGWEALCKKAKSISESENIPDYWVYGISRAENMDVYLGQDIVEVEKEDIINPTAEKKLLMLKTNSIAGDPELSTVVQNKELHQIGDYTIVLFP